MTDTYWQQRYARDPLVLGSIVKLQGVPFTVVGISARGFAGVIADAAYAFVVPLTTSTLIERAFGEPDDRPIQFWNAFGRLAPGIGIDEARAQLAAMWPAVREANVPSKGTPEERTQFLTLGLNVSSAARGFSFMRELWTGPLGLLAGATGWMLLIACMNLASLATARAIRRRPEMIVRSALGASRWRLVQQELVQSLLLSGTGTALALPLAWWGVRAIGPSLFFWQDAYTTALTLGHNWRVVIMVVGSAVLTGVATGIAPALQSGHRELHASLHGSRATSLLVSRWAERLLIVQLALAVALLVGAGVFSKSLAKLRAVDTGMAIDGTAFVELGRHPARDPALDPVAYSTRLADRLVAVPGVRSVAFAFDSPLGGIEAADWKEPIAPADSPLDAGNVQATLVAVSPNFFRTLGIPIRGGRDFGTTDDSTRPRVAIVSAALAGKLFGSGQLLGRQIRLGSEARFQHIEIVGISADARLSDLHTKEPRFVFLPLLQGSPGAQTPSAVVLRVSGAWAALQPAIRKAIESLGQDYVTGQRTLGDQIEHSLIRERLLAEGADIFGVMAAALVAIGLSGVIGSMVASRTREIGIRAALGARRLTLRRMVLAQAIRMAVLGLALGLPAAWMAGRWLTSALTDVSPHDPFTFVASACGLFVISLAAAWLPARRAAAVDPIEALRAE